MFLRGCFTKMRFFIARPKNVDNWQRLLANVLSCILRTIVQVRSLFDMIHLLLSVKALYLNEIRYSIFTDKERNEPMFKIW